MRVAFLVYGVFYVVIEIVGYQLEQVSWPKITALDVASALTDAFLTVAVLVAVLVTIDVLGHRLRHHLQVVELERARSAVEAWADPDPITVQSWRPAPPALQAAQAPVGSTRAGNAYARRAWQQDPATGAGSRLL